MKTSVKQSILNYLTGKNFVAGGLIEDYIRTTEGHHKASNASRRCRELVNEGKIESRYIRVPGVTNAVVEYRLPVEGNLEQHLFGLFVESLPAKEVPVSEPISKFQQEFLDKMAI